MGLSLQREEGHLVKAVGQLRILLHLLQDHVRHLGNAGYEKLDVPLLLMLRILPVVLHDAVHGGVRQQLLNASFRLAGELGDLRGGFGLAKAHLQHNLRNLIVGTCAVENNIFRVALRETLDAEFVGKAVRDHFSQIKQYLSCHNRLLSELT